jgi:hypothetical protein
MVDIYTLMISVRLMAGKYFVTVFGPCCVEVQLGQYIPILYVMLLYCKYIINFASCVLFVQS